MMTHTTTESAFAKAQRMARYGHKDWIVYGGKALPATAANLEAMLAENGEDGAWSLVGANDGVAMKGYGWLARNVISLRKSGY